MGIVNYKDELQELFNKKVPVAAVQRIECIEGYIQKGTCIQRIRVLWYNRKDKECCLELTSDGKVIKAEFVNFSAIDDWFRPLAASEVPEENERLRLEKQKEFDAMGCITPKEFVECLPKTPGGKKRYLRMGVHIEKVDVLECCDRITDTGDLQKEYRLRFTFWDDEQDEATLTEFKVEDCFQKSISKEAMKMSVKMASCTLFTVTIVALITVIVEIIRACMGFYAGHSIFGVALAILFEAFTCAVVGGVIVFVAFVFYLLVTNREMLGEVLTGP